MVDDALLERSGREFSVLDPPRSGRCSLSCSVVTPVEIELGLDRLGTLVETLRAQQ